MPTCLQPDPLYVPFDVQPLLAYCGEVVRQARLKRGWSEAELGQRIGLKKSAIAAFEAGQGELAFKRIVHLLYVLGVSFEDMLPPHLLRLSPPLVALVTLLQRRDPAVTRRTLALLQAFPVCPRRRVR